MSDHSPETAASGNKKRTLPDRLLSSPRLTVGLLLVLAAASIVGTVFPQGEQARHFLSRLGPGTVSFIGLLQLDDLFHATWYMFLGGLLALNLLFCLYRRWPSLRKTLPARAVFSRGLHRFVVHGGVLIILAGAALSHLFGIEAYTEIPVGEKIEQAFLRKDDRPLDLGFQVRCDAFHFERYESGMPKEYRSELTFFRDSSPVHEAPVRVNQPVSFEGITFYQSDFRKILKARLAVRNGGETREVERLEGQAFDLTGNGMNLSVLVVSIMENFMTMGPAVKLLVRSPEGCRDLYVFRNIDRFLEKIPDLYERYPPFDPGNIAPWRFELAGLEETYVTGLMVNRDPGAPVAAGGAAVLMAGMLLTYFNRKNEGNDRRGPAKKNRPTRGGGP